MTHDLHPVVIKGLIKVLMRIEPQMPTAVAANLAGDIVRRLGHEGISVLPDVMLEPITSEAKPKDRWDELFERQAKIEAAWDESGRQPWNPPELN